jgi:hypothetical protein
VGGARARLMQPRDATHRGAARLGRLIPIKIRVADRCHLRFAPGRPDHDRNNTHFGPDS